VTEWTTERGEDGAGDRLGMRALKGTTLLMSTEELLAVLYEWPGRATPPVQSAAAPPEPEAPLAPVVPIRPQRVVRAAVVPAAPAPRPGLLRRLRCGRRGHDPRPHRPQPNDDVVYRCVRCGMQMPAPERPAP
jgi:hypothetical protein